MEEVLEALSKLLKELLEKYAPELETSLRVLFINLFRSHPELLVRFVLGGDALAVVVVGVVELAKRVIGPERWKSISMSRTALFRQKRRTMSPYSPRTPGPSAVPPKLPELWAYALAHRQRYLGAVACILALLLAAAG